MTREQASITLYQMALRYDNNFDLEEIEAMMFAAATLLRPASGAAEKIREAAANHLHECACYAESNADVPLRESLLAAEKFIRALPLIGEEGDQ